jgi:hypothetical protein
VLLDLPCSVGPYLQGQQLFGYVNGEIPCPPELIFTSTIDSYSSVLVNNPTYTLWFHQDKIIFSDIISSLTEGILAHIVGL